MLKKTRNIFLVSLLLTLIISIVTGIEFFPISPFRMYAFSQNPKNICNVNLIVTNIQSQKIDLATINILPLDISRIRFPFVRKFCPKSSQDAIETNVDLNLKSILDFLNRSEITYFKIELIVSNYLSINHLVEKKENILFKKEIHL